ncbi:precorrin-2 C(20)-methyltransferase [Candidatus Magnetominusculus xianensis]|uniref:Precorrin-2 C(20)-methyltransferase n=1 Tax=Candidatus Magnetominusculus xianensis TaxID=1748249 RepID=A0ABR5SJK5_9BACT|nr:precorrin-2 C(20)-methyltransferase [Candidatus Magnetominusculus xianensis]KWT94657.1 precorrin-2 C(20)-methyltransferase [Candidatus Magnetominusculus xianensis]MBF0403369.1 precorrin-2 C(20)-methyltransferase [Nitrospirota bacterium]
MNNNIVHSIGLGPGDPELVTIKAKRILETSDDVIVPQSDALGRSVAKDIIVHYVDSSRLIMYYFPMNNNKEQLRQRYTELAEKIKALVADGRKVSYVSMGDPTIFSTSNYLTETLLARGINVVHVPGISSINASSSLLGIPLTSKGGDFGVYELPEDVQRTVELIQRHQTTVFMKVNKKLPVLLEAIKSEPPDAAYLVNRVTLDGQQSFDLLNELLPKEPLYLSIALVKKKKLKGTK